MTEEILPILTTCLKNHRILSSQIFEDMWRNDILTPVLKLFTAYLIDEHVTELTNKSQNDPQLQNIIAWEKKNGLRNILSENYQKCLDIFEEHNIIYESEWSIHGVPRKYNLNKSFIEHIFSIDFSHRKELEIIKAESK
jgi:hypothetical protein